METSRRYLNKIKKFQDKLLILTREDFDKSAGNHYCLLPFMVEEETTLGKSFHELLRCVQHGQPKLVWKKIFHTINGGAPHLAKIDLLTHQVRMFVSFIMRFGLNMFDLK
jgi:hypothetical protein